MITRKKLLLLLLVLGMDIISVNAQNRKDEVKTDSTSNTPVAKKNKKKSKVLEERGDSVRVLEWVQCTVCWGSGACPVCKKYGKRYEGTQLTTCSECLGNGRCRQCFGKGGDHYYVWKHKSTLAPLQASAASVEIDGIWYNLVSKKNTAEVTKKPSGEYSGAIVIPEKVSCNGTEYNVTSIGKGAFYKCTSLTTVTIPNSVTTIGDAAFAYCTGLTSFTIPNSVTTIGAYAFYDCSGLPSIMIPDSVKSIGIGAFARVHRPDHHQISRGSTR